MEAFEETEFKDRTLKNFDQDEDAELTKMEIANSDGLDNLHSGVSKPSVKKQSALSSGKDKPSSALRVHFYEYVKVNEFEKETQPPTSDEQESSQDTILKNMFPDDEEEENKGEVSQRNESASGWGLVSAVFSASNRLATLARMPFGSTTEDANKTMMRRYAIDGLASISMDDDDDQASEGQHMLEEVKEEIVPVEAKSRFDSLTEKLLNFKRRPIVEPVVVRRSSGGGEEVLFRYGTLEDPEHSIGRIIKKNKNETYQRVRNEKTDPFQFFEIDHEVCHQLKIRVLRGRNISKGVLQDMLDTPDPYVIIHIRDAPDGKKQTSPVDNNPNPEWNEELTYLLPVNAGVEVLAEIHLMDSNYSVDEKLGSIEFDVAPIPLQETTVKTFSFNETSEVDMEFYKEVKGDPDLRCSLALCNQEKNFRTTRKKIVLQSMREMLQKQNTVGWPRTLREVPTVAVIGSGGGFRAMTGYSGAIKALHDSGILDCCTYVSGLSGSSWYLATLYAHKTFPKQGTDATNKEIRNNIQNSPFWLLRPECLMTYSHRLHAKMKLGQPVTFVDFFGMLIGQTLLGREKMNTTKLSDFHKKIDNGEAPLPLLTCLHVRPKMSAMTFHDWVEFTPYEVGMPKYGTFMKTQHFGSKFFMGVMAKQFEESPLHFLMGVWGSAFSILFKRLLEKNKGISRNDNKGDDMRKELEDELEQTMKDDENDMNDAGSDAEFDSEDDDKFEDAVEDKAPLPQEATEKRPSLLSSLWSWGTGTPKESVEEVADEPAKLKKTKPGFFESFIGGMFGCNFLESREYRAGKILNYMRGVSLNKTYPLSPFTPEDASYTIAEDGEFQKLHEPIEVKRKKVHLVDAGLTFNSPYPAMLRPQRAVDLIISFDFSARPEENCEPFKEILLAEKWARIHHLPFPKIDSTVYEREGMKECYVFKDESNERAPIIVHFVLCNIQFRKFSAPGVRRKSDDKRGDFNIFDTPKTPYSTFNFQYSNDAFDKLHKLVEFNTLLHVNTIIEELKACITLRRHSKIRGSITLNDIRNSVHMSAKNKKNLESAILKSPESDRIVLD